MEMFQKEPLLARSSNFVQALALLLILLLSLLFTTLFAMVLALPFLGADVLDFSSRALNDLSSQSHINYMKYLQTMSQIAVFIIPSVFFSYLIHRKVFDYLKLNTRFTWAQLILSVLLIYVSLPLLGILGNLNQQMVLPEFLSGIESWMKNAEESASRQIMVFLNVQSVGAILFNFFMIALIPAIGEELLFRGVLIRFFKKCFSKIHIAVIVSAVLFSAFHFQFYGFLPRFFLGLVLGYAFVFTSSLWIPIILHFLNNATVLFVHYTYEQMNVEEIGKSDNTFVILLFTMLFFLTFYVLYKQRSVKKNTA